MGLVNRLTPPGKALDGAIELAEALCRFPQACMRSDRLSSYEQWSLPFDEAMQNELRRGQAVLASGETISGAQRFATGQGRQFGFVEGVGQAAYIEYQIDVERYAVLVAEGLKQQHQPTGIDFHEVLDPAA